MEFFSIDLGLDMSAIFCATGKGARKDAKKVAKENGGKVVKVGRGKNKEFYVYKNGKPI